MAFLTKKSMVNTDIFLATLFAEIFVQWRHRRFLTFLSWLDISQGISPTLISDLSNPFVFLKGISNLNVYFSGYVINYIICMGWLYVKILELLRISIMPAAVLPVRCASFNYCRDTEFQIFKYYKKNILQINLLS